VAVGVRLGPVVLKQGFDETLDRARSGDERAFVRI
jgi:hypothetical protein